MKGFAESEVFEPFEVELWKKATALVERLPAHVNDDEEVRCHEVARVVGEQLGLMVRDGHFGFVEHSWLWVEPYEGSGEQLWRLPNILDVYVPGELPQVQLIHTTSALPMPYRFGPTRTDIREDVMKELRKCLI